MRPGAILAAALALVVAGCGTTGPFASYPISADDACGGQRQALKAYQDYFFSAMIQGAAVGAAVGGLAGYLAGNNTQSTLLGAGAGAVAGGAGGYFLAKQKANSDPAALTGSVYQDVSKENSQLDGVSLAFRNLRDCRLRSAEQVKSDYAAKRIARDDAQARLAKIKALFVADVTFAESLGAKAAERGSQYDAASTQIEQLDPTAKATLAARQRAAGTGAAGGGGGGGGLVANEAARVRETASASARQVATLAPGDAVAPLDAGDAPAEWSHVRLGDGRTGYVASRLLRPAGTRAPSADAAGVAQLTESNQLKRKALSDEVAQAKNDANGSSFELGGAISRLPRGGPLPRAA